MKKLKRTDRHIGVSACYTHYECGNATVQHIKDEHDISADGSNGRQLRTAANKLLTSSDARRQPFYPGGLVKRQDCSRGDLKHPGLFQMPLAWFTFGLAATPAISLLRGSLDQPCRTHPPFGFITAKFGRRSSSIMWDIGAKSEVKIHTTRTKMARQLDRPLRGGRLTVLSQSTPHVLQNPASSHGALRARPTSMHAPTAQEQCIYARIYVDARWRLHGRS